MKAVIKLDVPDFQIGQEVMVYFKDTMTKHGICEADTIVCCKDCYKKRICYQDCEVDDNWFCADGKLKVH